MADPMLPDVSRPRFKFESFAKRWIGVSVLLALVSALMPTLASRYTEDINLVPDVEWVWQFAWDGAIATVAQVLGLLALIVIAWFVRANTLRALLLWTASASAPIVFILHDATLETMAYAIAYWTVILWFALIAAMTFRARSFTPGRAHLWIAVAALGAGATTFRSEVILGSQFDMLPHRWVFVGSLTLYLLLAFISGVTRWRLGVQILSLTSHLLLFSLPFAAVAAYVIMSSAQLNSWGLVNDQPFLMFLTQGLKTGCSCSAQFLCAALAFTLAARARDLRKGTLDVRAEVFS